MFVNVEIRVCENKCTVIITFGYHKKNFDVGHGCSFNIE